MKRIQITKHILNEWIDKHLSVHSDWTGSRIETIDTCDSLDEFLDNLWAYLEDASDRMD
jgi:hypothetical protein